MRRGNFLNIQWTLLTPIIILVILGLTTLFSINFSLFKTQLIFFIVSLFAYVFFCNVDYKILKSYSIQIYILSIIVLSFVLILGIESRGATRWIDIFGLRIQFSEFLKPFLAFSISSFLSSKNASFKTFVFGVSLIIPIVFLILIQPDLGNALIYAIVSFLTFIIFGFSFFFFFLIFLATVVSLPFFWNFMHEYQRQRILTFLNPTKDPLGASYNSIQSIVAIGSGMFFGKGLGEGTQSILRFLPERHTDFIFATFSEEFGFLGALILILIFGYLLYQLILIFQSSKEEFCKIFISCSFLLILIQLFINIGMNIGLIPVVGVTLPFVSYGGSSLLSNFILLGLVSSIKSTLRDRNVLEIR